MFVNKKEKSMSRFQRQTILLLTAILLSLAAPVIHAVRSTNGCTLSSSQPARSRDSFSEAFNPNKLPQDLENLLNQVLGSDITATVLYENKPLVFGPLGGEDIFVDNEGMLYTDDSFDGPSDLIKIKRPWWENGGLVDIPYRHLTPAHAPYVMALRPHLYPPDDFQPCCTFNGVTRKVLHNFPHVGISERIISWSRNSRSVVTTTIDNNSQTVIRIHRPNAEPEKIVLNKDLFGTTKPNIVVDRDCTAVAVQTYIASDRTPTAILAKKNNWQPQLVSDQRITERKLEPVQFSACGKYLLTRASIAPNHGYDELYMLWEVATAKLMGTTITQGTSRLIGNNGLKSLRLISLNGTANQFEPDRIISSQLSKVETHDTYRTILAKPKLQKILYKNESLSYLHEMYLSPNQQYLFCRTNNRQGGTLLRLDQLTCASYFRMQRQSQQSDIIYQKRQQKRLSAQQRLRQLSTMIDITGSAAALCSVASLAAPQLRAPFLEGAGFFTLATALTAACWWKMPKLSPNQRFVLQQYERQKTATLSGHYR